MIEFWASLISQGRDGGAGSVLPHDVDHYFIHMWDQVWEPGCDCQCWTREPVSCSSWVDCETMLMKRKSQANLSPQVLVVTEGSHETPIPQTTKRKAIFRYPAWYMCTSGWPHNKHWPHSPRQIVSRNRSRQSELRVSHRAFNLFLLLAFMNRGKRSFIFFILFHYNNDSVNSLLEVSFEVWGTSCLMKMQICYAWFSKINPE